MKRLVPTLIAALLLARAAVAEDAALASSPPPAEPIARSLSLFPVILPDGEPSADAAAFAEALRSGLGRNLEAAGYSVADEKDALAPDLPEPAEASSRARKAGSAWAAVCELSLAGGRIAYRVAIYDAGEGALAAGDSFSAFSGLAAIPLMNDTTARTVQRLSSYEDEKRGVARALVGYRILVDCPVEGAEVSIDLPGSSAGIPAGTVRNGRLELPYFPFVQGSTLGISARAEGRAAMRATITLGAEAPVVALSERRLRLDLLAGTGTGRLMGAGGGLRLYPGSEWFFGFAEDRVYAGYDFKKGSSPLLHEEFWNGLGWYLFFPPSSRFRLGYQMGYGILFSMVSSPGQERRLFCDLALLPVNFFGEYGLGKDRALWLSLGSAYSIGARGTGLLPSGWMGGGAPSISAGMLWRRR
jgi:hypothetical protein